MIGNMPGLLVVGLLGRARVGKQPRDVRLAAQERRRRARREQRVELAVAQHADQRLVLADRLEVEARDRLERRALVASGLLLAAAAPMDVGRAARRIRAASCRASRPPR